MNNSAEQQAGHGESVLEKFESLWEATPEPDLDQFLKSHGLTNPEASEQQSLLIEILSIDLERRFRLNPQSEDQALVKPYLMRFTKLSLPVVKQLVHAEWQLRCEAGHTLSASDFVRQMPGLQQSDADNLVRELGSLPTITKRKMEANRSSNRAPVPRVQPDRIGPFQILKKLGEGGMGEVWLARNEELSRDVAIKVILKSQLSDDPDVSRMMQDRFLVEAQAAGRLDHPGIVRVHSFGQDAEGLFIEMEFVDGTSLRKWTPKSCLETAALLRDVALAVHYAHSRAIIHRDLKPENILLTRDGVPRIMDFGLAKIVDANSNLTQDNVCMGTPNYMSPEQFVDVANVTTATDIYSLGVILYELLQGAPPFRWSGEIQTFINRVSKEEPGSPKGTTLKVPRSLQNICLKCLAKEPARRYASASQLAADLTNFLEDRPVSARRVTPPERFWLMCRRHPLTSTLVSLICSSLLIFLVVLWNLQNEARGQSRVALSAVNDFFIQVYNNDAFRQPGLRALRKDLNDRARQLQDGIDFSRLGGSGEDRRIIATAHFLNALRETESGGDTDTAISELNTSQTILQSLLTENSNDLYVIGTLGDALVEKGRIYHQSKPPDFEAAEMCYQRSKQYRQQLLDVAPNDIEYRRKLASVTMNLGALAEKRVPQIDNTEANAQKISEGLEVALKYFKQAETCRGEPETDQLRRDHANNLFNIGNVEFRLYGHETAKIKFKEAETSCRQLLARNPWDVEIRLLLVQCLHNSLPAEMSLSEGNSKTVTTIGEISAEASDAAALLADFDPETAKTEWEFLLAVHVDFANFLWHMQDLEGVRRELARATKVLHLENPQQDWTDSACNKDQPEVIKKLAIIALRFACQLVVYSDQYLRDAESNTQDINPLIEAEQYLGEAKRIVAPFDATLRSALTPEGFRKMYTNLNGQLERLDALATSLRTTSPKTNVEPDQKK